MSPRWPVAALVGCTSFPRAEDEGGRPWIVVSTPHFSLARDLVFAAVAAIGTFLLSLLKGVK